MDTHFAQAPAPAAARAYSLRAVLGGAASTHPFQRSLAGVAVGAGTVIHALADDEVRAFAANGEFLRAWPAPPGATCLAVGPDGHVYLGSLGQVDIYTYDGHRVGGFHAGDEGHPAAITAIKAFHDEVLVGDAAARCIRRYDRTGRPMGMVGNQDRTHGFMLPNRSLDFDVDAHGVIHATDTGRHRVARWRLDGTLASTFGKFGHANPEDFVGCCNPVNLALAPDGTVVTGEKLVARVKVYASSGRLLGVIGTEHFDQKATHLFLAVDANGRILAGDPISREVKVFAA
jgi:hypothetical protein